MSVRAEQLRAFHADGPIAESGAFGGAGDDADVLGHGVLSRDKKRPPRWEDRAGVAVRP